MQSDEAVAAAALPRTKTYRSFRSNLLSLGLGHLRLPPAAAGVELSAASLSGRPPRSLDGAHFR